MSLKEIRKQYQLSQLKASEIINIPLRTYIRYEDDEDYGDSLKRDSMIRLLNDACEITEEKGILSVNQIQKGVSEVLNDYKDTVHFCYLFGSYSKGYATEKSDVDLCISTTLTGLKYVGLAEKLHEKLHKKIDLIRLSDLNDNIELITEIMKGGKKIYG